MSPEGTIVPGELKLSALSLFESTRFQPISAKVIKNLIFFSGHGKRQFSTLTRLQWKSLDYCRNLYPIRLENVLFSFILIKKYVNGT